MRDTIIFVSTFSFLGGVFLSSIFTIPTEYFWIFGVVFVVLIVSFFLLRKKTLLLVSCGVLFVFLGIFRFHHKDIREPKTIFDDIVGSEVQFEGVIQQDPDRRENNQRVIVGFEGVDVLVSTELYPEFTYGDLVQVSGVLEKPENFKTDIGKEFDYIHYLSKDSIYYTISYGDVTLVSSGHGSGFMSVVLKTKHTLLNTLEKIIPPPQSSLLGGLLLGTKQSLGKDLEQRFIDTGLIHIVVLSGYNVTIVAEAIMRLLSFLPLVASVATGSLAIVLFALMTGAGATIVRASIMAIIALIARATGNAFHMTRALMFAGFLMVLHNPYILYFDLSFQLSFLATLGLIYLSPLFEKYFQWLPKKFGLREIASATLATQIFVLPFILYTMGTLSLIAPFTNLLVLPFVPLTMFFGFLTGLVGLLSPIVAIPFGFVVNVLLKFEIAVVTLFSKLQFAVMEVKNFPLWLALVVYLIIFWFLYKQYKIYSNEQRT